MSGVGQRVGLGADVEALMAANPQDAGRQGEYEVAAGGFQPPGQGEEPTPPSEPTPAEVQQQESSPREMVLGRPPAPEETHEEPAPAEEHQPSIDYDSIIAGLTEAAQREREARQSVQESLRETQRRYEEAEAFRRQYEPHIHELSELWPTIRQREVALEQATQQQALLDRKLALYKAAVQEAGLQVDDSSVDQQFMQYRLMQALENLPNTIDQRLAHALDSRTAMYQQSEAQRAAQQAQAEAEAAKKRAAAEVLDKFYKDNPGMEDFDRFVRPAVESDPTTDPRTIAAPFLRHTAVQAARRRAESAGQVQVQPGSQTGQAPASRQQASSQQDLAGEFANMSLDEQFAKARRMGLI